MRCPNCGKKVGRNLICENCKLKFVYEGNRQTIYIAIIILTVLLTVLAIFLNYITDYNKKHKNIIDETTTTKAPTENVGYGHDETNPADVGQTLVTSYFDGKNYYDVDVKGIRFIDSSEAVNYAKNTISGFNVYGFEYEVEFNSLDGMSDLSPVLNAQFSLSNGFDFIKYNGKKYRIKIESYYNGPNIKNKESAKVILTYELPEGITNYSICLGYYEKKIACFAKKEV